MDRISWRGSYDYCWCHANDPRFDHKLYVDNFAGGVHVCANGEWTLWPPGNPVSRCDPEEVIKDQPRFPTKEAAQAAYLLIYVYA